MVPATSAFESRVNASRLLRYDPRESTREVVFPKREVTRRYYDRGERTTTFSPEAAAVSSDRSLRLRTVNVPVAKTDQYRPQIDAVLPLHYRRERSVSPRHASGVVVRGNIAIPKFFSLLEKANNNIFKSDFVSVLISSKEIGSLIGKGGEIIKEINSRHECFISITNNFSAHRIGCISFKNESADDKYVDVLLEVAGRLTEDRDDKTLRLTFPLPATKFGEKTLVEEVEVQVMEVSGEREELRTKLLHMVPLLKYTMNLVCHS